MCARNCRFLGTLIILCTSSYALIAQPTEKDIPNGTQGEYFKSDSLDKQPEWEYAGWNRFDGPLTNLVLGGGFLYEYAAFSQDATAKQQMDSAGVTVENAFKVRDFRVLASGKFKFKRVVTWKAGIMFDAPTNTWFMRETGIMVAMPKMHGHIFVGRTKEAFSLNKIMVGYAGWTMERQMALDVIPILADGIKWLGFLPKQRILWNIGIFHDAISKNQSFSTYARQLSLRVGWLPVERASSNTRVHLAAGYRVGRPEDGKMRLRSRPEATPAPYFIDTGEFLSNQSNHLGGEVYFTHRSFMMGSEFYWHSFKSPETGNPTFRGGDVFASYMLTGEERPYTKVSSIYGLVPVKRPVFGGGPGAWEVLVRFSSLDLTEGTLTGGKFWRITPMVNWYLSKDVRLELVYGYGVLDRFNLKGATQFFQARIQLTMLQ